MYVFIVKTYCIGAAINSANNGATDSIDTDTAALSLENVSEKITLNKASIVALIPNDNEDKYKVI